MSPLFALDQIALQFDGNTASSLSHRYLNGPAVDQILADEQVSSLTQPGNVLWPLADHLGTPRDILTYDLATDTATIVNHRVYDSFGVLTSEWNGSYSIAIGFTGVYFDTATGLNYHRNRWLDMRTGKWMSEDPIGFAAGDTNLSRYVGNNSTNFTDPSGLAPPPIPGTLRPTDPSGRASPPAPGTLRPGEEIPPDLLVGGPSDIPDSLKGKWKVSIVASGDHAWIRFESEDNPGEVHTLGRYKLGFGGRRDPETGQVLEPALISGVQWDREKTKEPGFKSGLFPGRSVTVCDPKIYKGSNPYGFGGWWPYGDARNNCTTFARDAWNYYSGEWIPLPLGIGAPAFLKNWIDRMNNPPDNQWEGSAWMPT